MFLSIFFKTYRNVFSKLESLTTAADLFSKVFIIFKGLSSFLTILIALSSIFLYLDFAADLIKLPSS